MREKRYESDFFVPHEKGRKDFPLFPFLLTFNPLFLYMDADYTRRILPALSSGYRLGTGSQDGSKHKQIEQQQKRPPPPNNMDTYYDHYDHGDPPDHNGHSPHGNHTHNASNNQQHPGGFHFRQVPPNLHLFIAYSLLSTKIALIPNQPLLKLLSLLTTTSLLPLITTEEGVGVVPFLSHTLSNSSNTAKGPLLIPCLLLLYSFLVLPLFAVGRWVIGRCGRSRQKVRVKGVKLGGGGGRGCVRGEVDMDEKRGLEEAYRTLFSPLHLSRSQFSKVVHLRREVRTLEPGEFYAMEKVTRVENLGLLLEGRLLVSQNGRPLHTIHPHQFIDSPEYFGVCTDDLFQVSIKAVGSERARVLLWHRDKLRLGLLLGSGGGGVDEFLSQAFDHVIGRDVVRKLVQVSNVSGSEDGIGIGEGRRGSGGGGGSKGLPLEVTMEEDSPEGGGKRDLASNEDDPESELLGPGVSTWSSLGKIAEDEGDSGGGGGEGEEGEGDETVV